MKNFKTIATYMFISEYAVLRLLLDQANITYVFQNETMVSVLPFHSNAVGGIRLKVHPDDVQKAEQILHDFNSSSNMRIV